MPARITPVKAVAKARTGLVGLDQVLHGGVPRDRNTLLVGGPGSGKTLIGMEFLLRGARDFGEPGVCMSFEETAEQLASNVASLGYDLHSLVRAGKLLVDYVYVERKEIEETGEYDLEGL